MVRCAPEQKIKTLAKTTDMITISFENDWFQDDIELLISLVFKPLLAVNIQEKIVGADRENIRFTWQEHFFILNFDCYSQSCWLEGQDNKSTDYLALLYQELTLDD